MGIVPSKKVEGYVLKEKEKEIKVIVPFLDKLAGIEKISFIESPEEIGQEYNIAISTSLEIYIPLSSLIDKEKMFEKLQKETENIEKDIARLETLLGNKNFTSKAPLKLIEQEQEKLNNQKEKLAKLQEKMQILNK